MSTYTVSLTVTWSATDEIEIEAKDEAEARYKAETYHEGITSMDYDEEYVEVHSIECIDEDDEEEEADALGYVPKEQIALPGCESLVASVVRR